MSRSDIGAQATGITSTAWRSTPFIAFSSIPRDIRVLPAATIRSSDENLRDTDGMHAIAISAKACKSTTFIALRRSHAAFIAAMRISW
jgi:hypothetical protein